MINLIHKQKINGLVLLFILSIFSFSCKKFVQVSTPPTAIGSSTVYANDLTAAAVLTGVYDRMMTNGNLASGYQSISFLAGLTSDELTNYTSSSSFISDCYNNTLHSSSSYFWNEIFQRIYAANKAIEGLAGSTGVTPSEKQQLIGEAKFIRAFFHFYGTNLFGDFPLVTTTNYQVNNTIQRSTQSLLYQQIVSDLQDAQLALSDNFLTPTGGVATTERVRPNKGAAASLLARVYLYLKKWDSAEAQATSVINSPKNYKLVHNLDSVFLKNSTEAIWQLQPVQTGYNTYDGYDFVLTSAPGSTITPVALSPSILNAFDSGDNRAKRWIGSITTGGRTYSYPYKYKIYTINNNQSSASEYLMVFRLAEQYLIRAEARAQQGNLQGAAADLNMIRNRAGLANTVDSASQANLLNAIYHERQVELFTEWGHRWFDLKRTGNIASVMTAVTPQKSKGNNSWNANWAVFPVPLSEILLNGNLTQNTGYQ